MGTSINNFETHGTAGDHGHVVHDSVFLYVLIALLVLTAVTVGVAQIDFGVWNIVVAMLVASVKASLVIFVFMHAKYENKILWTYIILPFVLMAIMIAGVMIDNPFRDTPQPITPAKVEVK